MSEARVVHVDDKVSDAVYIGRWNSRLRRYPSKWANPYKLTEMSRTDAIERYAEDLWGEKRGMLAELPELRGKALACWCRHDGEIRMFDNDCHGDVLVNLLNTYTDDELRLMATRGQMELF